MLDGIDLDVEEGEFIAILGFSGAGKTTLISSIAGLIEPDAGEILLRGKQIKGPDKDRGLVFQSYSLMPWLSVRGNVALVLEDHGLGKAQREAIIADVLARTKLTDFADALPKQLSGGMKQRVAIARALAVNPAVMLMDEPLSALDSQTRELLMDDLVDLWTRENFTAIYVTHNLAEAVRLGHRIVVLSRRPGCIRDVVDIDLPLAARTMGDADLEATQRRLWQMLRDEARAADRELADV